MPFIRNELTLFSGKKDTYLICDEGSGEVESYRKSLDYLSHQVWNKDYSVILGFDVRAVDNVQDYYEQMGAMLRRMTLKHVFCYGEQIETYA